MAQKLRLRTRQGPVGFRERREKTQVQVPEGAVVTIEKSWLRGRDEQLYTSCLKQALLMGARIVEMNDAMDVLGPDGDRAAAGAQARLQSIATGREKFSTAGHKKTTMKKVAKLQDREKHLLVKFSKRCCCDRRERSFLIENGELIVYKYHGKNARMCDPTYQLRDAQVFTETRVPGTYQRPRYEEGYNQRLRVEFPERTAQKKQPFYLYPKDLATMENWKRAFQLARILVSDNDRRALKVAIGRGSSTFLVKGWDALLSYYKEVKSTRMLVKQLSMRLLKSEMSRGWAKMVLVKKKVAERARKRNEQQVWAARFMSERLARLGTQNAKKASDVRETVVTRIQQRFRHYRDGKIFDRQYPIGPGIVSRTRQALTGVSMDVGLDVLTCEQVLLLSLTDQRSLARYKSHPEALQTKKSTYSDINLDAVGMLVSVSDNLQSLAFAEKTIDAWTNLAKTTPTNFVHLDRISHVVLNTTPHSTVKRATPLEDGVWCAIYGPRISWGKRIEFLQNKDGKQVSCNPVGARDGFLVPKTLGERFKEGSRIKWVNIELLIGEPTWNLEDPNKDRHPHTVPRVKGTILAVHIFGYRFVSSLAADDRRRYIFSGPLKASVPLADDDNAIVALDDSMLGVEIREVTEPAEDAPAKDGSHGQGVEHHKVILAGTESLWNVIRPAGGNDRLRSVMGTREYELSLAPPYTVDGPVKPRGKVPLQMTISMEHDSRERESRCVSPEFVGGGIPTSLFTSHRGAWHDAELGPGQFRLDLVANFVELTLGEFRFPGDDPPPKDDAGVATYRVRASLSGITAETPPMHRNKDKWAAVLGGGLADPYVIKFNGSRLCLPLPPGCWGDSRKAQQAGVVADDKRPRIFLEVIRGEHERISPLNYNDFQKAENRTRHHPPREEVVYRTCLIFGQILVDQEHRGKSAFFARGRRGDGAATDDVVIDVLSNMAKKGKPTDATLNYDFSLRDRDYVKGTLGQAGFQRTICVGDKAMMVTEEPLLYPQTPQEFRNRFVVGRYDSVKKEWPRDKDGRDRGAPLRDPCLSSEYQASGLGEMVPKVLFKQSIIPNYCSDTLPHKFVLPFTEQQFRQERFPGVWPYILDDLAAQKAGRSGGYGGRPTRTVVTHLSHVQRQVPVILLATYSDGTADVEIAPSFMAAWKEQPERKYCLPGVLVLGNPGPPEQVPAPAQGGKPGAPAPPAVPILRAILRKVPLVNLQAVHTMGFHIYDADHRTIDDTKNAPPARCSFNPRQMHSKQEEQCDFSLPVGPLPADASPAACQYEWSLHVRAPSHRAMHKFLAMIRQCVRMSHHQEVSRMKQYQNEPGEAFELPSQLKRQLIGGQLEVVLVEARRLEPVAFESTLHEFKKSVPFGFQEKFGPLSEGQLKALTGTTAGENSKSTPEGANISTFVNFRMRHNNEIVPFKNNKVQHSPIVAGTDSPSWAMLQELQSTGGWTFKTGLIDPEKLQDLVIEFEVMQFSMGISHVIGAIQLGVTQRPFLTNPKQPFRNLWLPLLSEKDGVVAANKTGEIHIMTRWLPAQKLYLAKGQGQQHMTVRSQFLKELWPRVCAQRVKEPIFGLEAQYLVYNPNLVRGRMPETPPDFVRRHTEELHSTVPHVECLDRRQTKSWETFEQQLSTEGLGSVRLGDLRLKWINDEDWTKLGQLQGLLEAGIPSSRRERLWLDMTMAARVLEVYGLTGRREEMDAEAAKRAAEDDYQRLLEQGFPQRSDANTQLQEDAFHLASWESSSPPSPELLDLHMQRLKRAQNVCIALIAFEEGGVAYCESLLIIAFFLLLPQGFKDLGEEGIEVPYMSESSAFWILYALIGTRVNGTYKEYYGRPLPVVDPGQTEARPTLCVGSGAMQDIALLECCLAYHEHDLWLKLTCLGFQLSTIFYGAFMRLFATYMPTATVFRFWDILLSQSSDPKAQPHARSYLIDLSFGMLRAKKKELLQCESALEAKTLILGIFASLYDTSTVVDVTLHANKFLWGGGGFSFGKVGHLWTQREELFRSANNALSEQNEILRVMTHERALGRIPQTKYESPPGAKGVTTKELLKDVLPVLQTALETAKRSLGSGRYWAMHRPMPLAARMVCENTLEKAWNMFSTAVRGPQLSPFPSLVGPPGGMDRTRPHPGLEPLDISAIDINNIMSKEIPSWAQFAPHLWRTFMNRRPDAQWRSAEQAYLAQQRATQPVWMNWVFRDQKNAEYLKALAATGDERISLNELFIALICCSKGTLVEKASALFNIYSYVEPMPVAPVHITPISRLAKSITKGGDGSGEHMGKNLTPPDPEKLHENALHLKVYSNYPVKNTLVGEVFVPTLGSFVGYNPNEAETQSYNIWGSLDKESWRMRGGGSPPPTGNDKAVVGDMELAVTWTPKSIKNPEEGQLCLKLRSIRFFKMFVSDYFRMNPRVTVSTYRDGQPVKIPRWDPRGVLSTDQHVGMLATGAYGGHIEFEPTMRDGLIGHGEYFHHWIRHGADMGWNAETEEWVWNDTWGKQFSSEGFTMSQSFMSLPQRKNVMDMQGVRHIVAAVLHRSLLNVTNRQALLIADSVFNRSGAVPGILEAWLVGGDPPIEYRAGQITPETSLRILKDSWAKDGQKTVDVTSQILLEHERQVQKHGFLNLFNEAIMKSGPVTLADMHITDPFKGSRKMLWVRFVRSGDGERCTQGVRILADGRVDENGMPEVKFDQLDAWPETKVTKDEFISCMLNNPLIGESLRRIGATDHVPHQRKAIPLDVTIMDPHQEEVNEFLMDAVNVHQSVLLEVWDSDIGAKDFLGEAWLPPLASLSAKERDFVLPLRAADYSEDAENGPSREDKDKIQTTAGEASKITGEVYVSLAWKYPAYDTNELSDLTKGSPESTSGRALIQEKLHTGKFWVTLKRATNLRRADMHKGRDCDPQVSVWVRNDILADQEKKCWRRKPLARSTVARNNRNPKWTGEFKESPFEVMSGSYEARFPPKAEGWFEEVKHAFRTRRQNRYIREDREMNAIKKFGGQGLRLRFHETVAEAPANAEGEMHKMEVFLGDTIREFKTKLTTACDHEASYWAEKGATGTAIEQKFRDVRIGFKHLVMVFVPSLKVQRLWAQKLHEGQEYKHAYNQAIQDPSNWQPLDPTRTFGQYPQFGFGRKQPQLLRIVEATESYKLLNLRYKEFDREMGKKPYQDTNTEEKCFGYAKFHHQLDRASRHQSDRSEAQQAAERDFEWRPAFIYKSGGAAQDPANAKFKVDWLYRYAGHTRSAASGAMPAAAELGMQEVPKSDILMAPRCPLIDIYVHPRHAEVLEQAKTLRTLGKSDWEIEVMLNKELDTKWEMRKKEGRDLDEGSRPPRITVDIIRTYLQRHDAVDASKSSVAKPAGAR